MAERIAVFAQKASEHHHMASSRWSGNYESHYFNPALRTMSADYPFK